MRKSLIEKLVDREPVDDSDLANALFDICEREHSSCNMNCPVYEANDGQCVNADRPFKENRGCDCFKDGHAMLNFLRGTK